ncbi:hypothetical protein SUGI_0029000 [Cryptomeria japonica]|nr:hypothetical protein SUGI_0029000 [Cryptomeria japonica]
MKVVGERERARERSYAISPLRSSSLPLKHSGGESITSCCQDSNMYFPQFIPYSSLLLVLVSRDRVRVSWVEKSSGGSSWKTITKASQRNSLDRNACAQGNELFLKNRDNGTVVGEAGDATNLLNNIKRNYQNPSQGERCSLVCSSTDGNLEEERSPQRKLDGIEPKRRMADPIARKQLTEVMKLAAEVQVESIVEFSSRDEEDAVGTSVVKEAQNYCLERLGDDNKNVFDVDIAQNALKASSGDIESATEMDNCSVSMKLSASVLFCDHAVSLEEGVDDWGTLKKSSILSSRIIKNQLILDMENEEAVRIGDDVRSPSEDFGECSLNPRDAKVVRDVIYQYHTHDVPVENCSLMVAQQVSTSVELVWPVVSRLDKPQPQKHFVRNYNMVCDVGSVGSVREVSLGSKFPATTNTKRPEDMERVSQVKHLDNELFCLYGESGHRQYACPTRQNHHVDANIPFDYFGTQTCEILKEEGYEVNLINCNAAIIMTDLVKADKTYIAPMTPN